jgi:hypothetical protein
MRFILPLVPLFTSGAFSNGGAKVSIISETRKQNDKNVSSLLEHYMNTCLLRVVAMKRGTFTGSPFCRNHQQLKKMLPMK